MKKLLSFALVLVMAFTFCTPICAENNDGILIATDFKDGKTQFIPLNLGESSSNIVTVDGRRMSLHCHNEYRCQQLACLSHRKDASGK